MSLTGSAGVATVGRILARLADGGPMTVSQLVADEHLVRSTAFDVVRRLERSGMVRRDEALRLRAGPAGARLGLSAFGMQDLHGPAEALLTWLTEHTGAPASLTVRRSNEDCVLMTAAGAWAAGPRDPGLRLSASVLDMDGDDRATLRLLLPGATSRADIATAQAHLSRACRTLAAFFPTEPCASPA